MSELGGRFFWLSGLVLSPRMALPMSRAPRQADLDFPVVRAPLHGYPAFACIGRMIEFLRASCAPRAGPGVFSAAATPYASSACATARWTVLDPWVSASLEATARGARHPPLSSLSVQLSDIAVSLGTARRSHTRATWMSWRASLRTASRRSAASRSGSPNSACFRASCFVSASRC